MPSICAQCSSVNPLDAAYCYRDGAPLSMQGSGRLNPGAALFASPFVFPNGQACRNFDQLATACQHNWGAALELLREGFLASFFGGLGRLDLAVAAREASQFPDPDRGLDQLLTKIPSQVLEDPKILAEPSEINLGRLAVGEDRTIELHLRNGGMRLLYGSVASDCKWLTLGDAPGQPEKLFQFGDETMIVVQVRGQHLRAGTRPLEGRLILDSNGGTSTVTVRADVPVLPFVGGPLDGAVTPRHIAETAKANPKETATYFESGQVAAWFQGNGWTYPVQGPPMTGMGAVQQFFEALGVAKPPKVQVSPAMLRFEGAPGNVFDVILNLSSDERKVVYGWATSDRYWAVVGKTKIAGRSAAIPITITVPDRKGVQEGQLTVTGNGQQKFVVPVSIAVIGGANIIDAKISDVAQTCLALPENPGTPAPAIPVARSPFDPSTNLRSPMPAMPPPLPVPVAQEVDTRNAFAEFSTAVNETGPRESDWPARGPRDDDAFDDSYPSGRRSGREDSDDYDVRRRGRRRRGDTSLSLTSMIIGIVSASLGLFAICCWVVLAPLAGLGGTAAVILGFMGKSRGGDGQATAGIVLGFVAIGLSILWMACGVFGTMINLTRH